MKKLLALFVVSVLVVASLSTVSFAAEANTNVYNGNYALTVVVADQYNFLGGGRIAVEPNTEYIVSGWAKGSGSVLLRLYDNDAWGSANDLSLDGSEWRQSSRTITTGEGVTSLGVYLVTNFYGGTGTKYVDDLFIAKASEPDTNLLSNGGFEDGSWGGYERAYSEVKMLNGAADPGAGAPTPNENVYNGNYSTKMAVSSYQQTGMYMGVEANTEYEVSWWSKGYGARILQVQASNTSDYSWGAYLGGSASVNGDTWQKSSFTFNSGEYTFVVFMAVCNSFNSTGTGYIDDVTITKVSDGTVVRTMDFEDGNPFNGGIAGHIEIERSAVSMVEGQAPAQSPFTFTDLADNAAEKLVVANGVKVTTAQEGVLVIAAYVDDMMIVAKSGTGEVSLTAAELKDAEEVRAFVVDGIKTLKPLVDAESIYE